MARLPHIDHLIWDDWNRDHIGKHGVLPEEAEEVVAGQPTADETYKQRLQLIDPSAAGRMLSVVIGEVPGRLNVYYVFSARPASRKERADYLRRKGGSLP